MDETDRARAATAPEVERPAVSPPAVHAGAGRSSRRPAAVLMLVLGALVAVCTVGYVVLTGGFGSTAPGADLEGNWSGTGTVVSCDGVVCPPGETITLAVDCSWSACTVSVFDEPAELQGPGDRVTAAGSIPPWHLDSCTGGGFVTGRWFLDLTRDGKVLTGRYTEEVTSGCGSVVSRTVSTTETSWDVELTRT